MSQKELRHSTGRERNPDAREEGLVVPSLAQWRELVPQWRSEIDSYKAEHNLRSDAALFRECGKLSRRPQFSRVMRGQAAPTLGLMALMRGWAPHLYDRHAADWMARDQVFRTEPSAFAQELAHVVEQQVGFPAHGTVLSSRPLDCGEYGLPEVTRQLLQEHAENRIRFVFSDFEEDWEDWYEAVDAKAGFANCWRRADHTSIREYLWSLTGGADRSERCELLDKLSFERVSFLSDQSSTETLRLRRRELAACQVFSPILIWMRFQSTHTPTRQAGFLFVTVGGASRGWMRLPERELVRISAFLAVMDGRDGEASLTEDFSDRVRNRTRATIIRRSHPSQHSSQDARASENAGPASSTSAEPERSS